jgi:hypothetical protein
VVEGLLGLRWSGDWQNKLRPNAKPISFSISTNMSVFGISKVLRNRKKARQRMGAMGKGRGGEGGGTTV